MKLHPSKKTDCQEILKPPGLQIYTLKIIFIFIPTTYFYNIDQTHIYQQPLLGFCDIIGDQIVKKSLSSLNFIFVLGRSGEYKPKQKEINILERHMLWGKTNK